MVHPIKKDGDGIIFDQDLMVIGKKYFFEMGGETHAIEKTEDGKVTFYTTIFNLKSIVNFWWSAIKKLLRLK